MHFVAESELCAHMCLLWSSFDQGLTWLFSITSGRTTANSMGKKQEHNPNQEENLENVYLTKALKMWHIPGMGI